MNHYTATAKTLHWLMALLLIGLSVGDAAAYIGPGAGFAVVSSFFILFVTALVAMVSILLWPFRAFILYMRRRRATRNRLVRRVVVVGLDGLSPAIASRLMRQGRLPNFKALADEGSFKPLRTTVPAISPVAWSTFSTGVNPGKHCIFDFFTRDPENYLPVLSSSRVDSYTKYVKLGPLKIPVAKTAATFLRKSTSLWTLLGKGGIFSSVVRVPITFPPEKCYGTCLSAMCAPDLRGTQGAFTLFTARPCNIDDGDIIEGEIVQLTMEGDHFASNIPGPTLGSGEERHTLSMPLRGRIDATAGVVELQVGETSVTLRQGKYSPWVKLEFKLSRRKKISGISRFMATGIGPEPVIYMTPINIDPEKPTLPVSHPFSYCVSLAKINGSFATLGLAEDTWALNERIIDEQAFLDQSYDIFEERKTHLFDALEKNRDGFVSAVFDTTDRVQHMFFRYLDPEHPANVDKDTERHAGAIDELYARMDTFVGEVRQRLHPDDVLMVISDHGFAQFKWGVNLNTWLWREGYLVLKEGTTPGATWFADVDWSQTRAFAYGLVTRLCRVGATGAQGEAHPLVQQRASRPVPVPGRCGRAGLARPDA